MRVPTFAAGSDIHMLSHMILAEKARADYNEALFNHVIALSDLEPIAGGSFDAGLNAPEKPTPITANELPAPKSCEAKN